MKNLFDNLPDDLPEELTETIIENNHVRIERIVSAGHTSPENFWYDQEESEWILLLKGEAKLLFEDKEHSIHMKPGDHIHIPAHRRHRVTWTSENEPTLWLALFYQD